jgi:hypothetical protein
LGKLVNASDFPRPIRGKLRNIDYFAGLYYRLKGKLTSNEVIQLFALLGIQTASPVIETMSEVQFGTPELVRNTKPMINVQPISRVVAKRATNNVILS